MLVLLAMNVVDSMFSIFMKTESMSNVIKQLKSYFFNRYISKYSPEDSFKAIFKHIKKCVLSGYKVHYKTSYFTFHR